MILDIYGVENGLTLIKIKFAEGFTRSTKIQNSDEIFYLSFLLITRHIQVEC